MTTLGYARVDAGSKLVPSDRRADRGRAERFFTDKITGKNAARSGITACIDYLPAGHVLLVHSTNRLGRSMTDILTIEGELHSRSIQFRSLA